MKNFKTNGLLVLSMLLLLSCHKDEPTPAIVIPSCGCESLSTGTITNSMGLLQRDSSNNLFIQIGTPPNITTFYYICNANFITFAVPPAGVNVTFSGSDAKNCKANEINPPNFIYRNIKLTQIQ